MREPGTPWFAYGDKNKYEVCELTGCWIWWGGWSASTRRGKIRVGKRTVMAYRYFYEKKYGKTHKQLAHTCQNSICVNPSHIVPAESWANQPMNQWHSDYYRGLEDIPF